MKNSKETKEKGRTGKEGVWGVFESEIGMWCVCEKKWRIHASPCKAKPSVEDLKEKDPLLSAFRDSQPDRVDSLLNDDETPTKGSTSKISEEVHETNDDSMRIAHYSARKHKKVDKNLKCVAKDCPHTFPFVKELNNYLKTVHLDIKFKCQCCRKVYESHNSC